MHQEHIYLFGRVSFWRCGVWRKVAAHSFNTFKFNPFFVESVQKFSLFVLSFEQVHFHCDKVFHEARRKKLNVRSRIWLSHEVVHIVVVTNTGRHVILKQKV